MPAVTSDRHSPSMQSYSLPDNASVEFEHELLGHIDESFTKGTVTPKSENQEAALEYLVTVAKFGSRTSTKSDPAPVPAEPKVSSPPEKE